MNETRERIGQRIAKLRKEQGMTQAELAERTGIQRAHITRIEAGRYSVGIDLLDKIAVALGMEVDFVEGH
jgi:transcriptional regulator with XRE-family HTH domain